MVFLFNILLNYYLKKSIEEEFNKTLNASVAVEKVEVSLFKGQILVYNLVAVGKADFENDTLISCELLILEPSDFDRKTKTLNFKRLLVDNIIIRNIISQKGNSCWENFIKEDAYKDTDSTEQNSIFLQKLVVTDGIIELHNRSDSSFYKFDDIDLVFDFQHDNSLLISDFDLRCKVFVDTTHFTDLALIGNFTNDNSKTTMDALLKIGLLPVNIDLLLDMNLNQNSVSHINAELDFSKLRYKNVKSSGLLKLDLAFSGFFAKNCDKFVTAELISDKLIFVNTAKSESFVADFNIIANGNYGKNLDVDFAINKLFIHTNNDTLRGALSMHYNDTVLMAKSNLNGKVNSKIFNTIFESTFWNTSLQSNFISDLDYYCSSTSEKNIGSLTINSKASCPIFSLTKSAFIFNGEELSLNFLFKSEYVNGSFKFLSNNFKEYFNGGIVKNEIVLNIDKLTIPEVKGHNDFKMNIGKPLETDLIISFPERSYTEITLSIAALKADKYKIINIVSYFVISPQLISLKSEPIKIGSGELLYLFELKKQDQDTLFITDLKLSSFDLNYFSDSKIKKTGILDVKIDNTLCFGSSQASANRNSGNNMVSLKGFRLPTSILRDYEIDMDTLIVKDFEARINLNNDSLIIEPFKLDVNGLIAVVSGNLNIKETSLDLSILMDSPANYLSPKIKLGLAFISEKSAVKLPQKKGRITRHLKISGDLQKPQFKVYE